MAVGVGLFRMEYLVRRRPLTQARPLHNTQTKLLTRCGADALRLGVDRDLHLGASVLLARIGVHLQQLGQVKLRLSAPGGACPPHKAP